MAKKSNKQLSEFLKSKNEGSLKKLSHYIPLIGLIVCGFLFFKRHIPLYDSSVLFGGIIPLFIVFNIVYFFIYLYLDVKDLTDNVKANRVFSPFVFILVLMYATMKLNMPIYDKYSEYYGGIGFSLLFILNYLYSSSYFQPDLDTSGARPGMTHFPVGKWIAASRYGRFIKWLFKPITVGWFKLWQPYAMSFTHRGATHMPILGVYLRVSYLWLICKIGLLIVQFLHFISHKVELFHSISLLLVKTYHFVSINIMYYLEIFYPWHRDFLSNKWVLICLPIFLGDLVHILVDLMDSVKRNKPFCHPQIPRGLFFHLFKEILKIFKNI
jgi:uncharacterized metal-binding protein